MAGIFQKFLKFVKIDLKLKEIMNLIQKLLTAWLWEQFHKLEFNLSMYQYIVYLSDADPPAADFSPDGGHPDRPAVPGNRQRGQ